MASAGIPHWTAGVSPALSRTKCGRGGRGPEGKGPMVTGISAVTLATHDMARAVAFYRMLGLAVIHGGEQASFKSFRIRGNFLILSLQPAGREWSCWVRLIFYDDDVDGIREDLRICDLLGSPQQLVT